MIIGILILNRSLSVKKRFLFTPDEVNLSNKTQIQVILPLSFLLISSSLIILSLHTHYFYELNYLLKIPFYSLLGKYLFYKGYQLTSL